MLTSFQRASNHRSRNPLLLAINSHNTLRSQLRSSRFLGIPFTSLNNLPTHAFSTASTTSILPKPTTKATDRHPLAQLTQNCKCLSSPSSF